ncbi:L-threonine ammonia-lyase [Natranaerofaba carboxydovora]|nr:L-threonine ammonia-lyase [Natranaerofaba carboxydovora]
MSNGVITASAGNHAQGVALASKKLGIDCTVVMPERAPLPKISATRGYGSKILLQGEGYDEAFAKANKICDKEGKTFIPAFDDYEVIAGQGTIALEIFEETNDIDVILVPVGGGGLISGIATYIKEKNPKVKVVGVQTNKINPVAKGHKTNENAIKEEWVSKPDEEVRTIADGIAVKKPGKKTMPIINRYVDDMVSVAEEDIAEAILLLLERNKIMVEGAGAVGLAALLKGELEVDGKNLVAVLSGGNIDVNMISRIIQRGLAKAGRITRIYTVVYDKPGALKNILNLISDTGANILSIQHIRKDPRLSLGMVGVDFDLETRDEEHINKLIDYLKTQGYKVQRK